MANILSRLMAALAFLVWSLPAFSQVWVNGYYRKNGTYVEGHWRTSPNNTVTDNYSYPGNYNPNTGKVTGGTAYYSSEGYSAPTYRSSSNTRPISRGLLKLTGSPPEYIDRICSPAEGYHLVSNTGSEVEYSLVADNSATIQFHFQNGMCNGVTQFFRGPVSDEFVNGLVLDFMGDPDLKIYRSNISKSRYLFTPTASSPWGDCDCKVVLVERGRTDPENVYVHMTGDAKYIGNMKASMGN